MRTLALFTAMALTACGGPSLLARPKTVALPDGTQAVTVHCPGRHRDIGDCMNEAARVCGGPYKILERDTESNGGAIVPVGNSLVYGNHVDRTLMVSCGQGS